MLQKKKKKEGHHGVFCHQHGGEGKAPCTISGLITRGRPTWVFIKGETVRLARTGLEEEGLPASSRLEPCPVRERGKGRACPHFVPQDREEKKIEVQKRTSLFPVNLEERRGGGVPFAQVPRRRPLSCRGKKGRGRVPGRSWEKGTRRSNYGRPGDGKKKKGIIKHSVLPENGQREGGGKERAVRILAFSVTIYGSRRGESMRCWVGAEKKGAGGRVRFHLPRKGKRGKKLSPVPQFTEEGRGDGTGQK